MITVQKDLSTTQSRISQVRSDGGHLTIIETEDLRKIILTDDEMEQLVNYYLGENEEMCFDE